MTKLSAFLPVFLVGAGLIGCGSDAASGSTTPTVCAITATLAATDAGSAALPSQHQFTARVDWKANTLTTGANGLAMEIPLVKSGDLWSTQESVPFTLPLTSDGSWYDTFPSITYQTVFLRPTTTGCAGSATGTYSTLFTDMVTGTPFNATLTGVVDQASPVFTVAPNSTNNVHPLSVEGVGVNELLSAATTAFWSNTANESIPMTSLPAGSAYGVSGFLLQKLALAFGATYQMKISSGAVDLAGNATGVLPSITTLADPGMFAQDGFEGEVRATMTGNISIVSKEAFPVASGNKALQIPVPPALCGQRFTARLSVPTAATTLQFSALATWPKTRSQTTFTGSVQVAVPNGAVNSYSWPEIASTALASPWTGALPGSADNSYGDLMQMQIPLPAGTNSEIIFDVLQPCYDPPYLGDGLIIDDLRILAGGPGKTSLDAGVDAAETPDLANARDVPGSADQGSESLPIGDAGECKGDAGDLEHLYFVEPCPSTVNAGVPTVSCYGYVGAQIYQALCGQRQTLRWNWGTHVMTCFYEQGSLVGLEMSNDTPSFCGGSSNSIQAGSVIECPPSDQTQILNCSPFVDGGL
jgi:hypothetical protein